MVAMIGTSGQTLAGGPGSGANPGMGELEGMSGSGLGEFFSNNAGLLGSLGGAGAGLLAGVIGRGDNTLPFQGDLTNITAGLQGPAAGLGGVAGQAQSESGMLFNAGQNLLSPISTGVLPAGAQAAVDRAAQDAKTASASRYASLGLSGSTMAADAAANIDQQKEIQQFQIEQQMFNSGLQATAQSLTALGITGQAYSGQANVYGEQAKIYEAMMKQQGEQDKSMMSSIGKFSEALGNLGAKALPLMLA